MPSLVELLQDLISRPSITPRDEGCQQIISQRLQPLGFHAERLCFSDTENCWLRRGNVPPLLVFAGHTDVVPPGPSDAWTSLPFVPALRDGMIYGRGAADMKGSLAAMVIAMERFIQRNPAHRGSIALLLTSDEEGTGENGTRRVMQWLKERQVVMDWCLLGEPSSVETVGDQIRIGRRGSLTGRLRVNGKQGHVAYPAQVENPIHCAGAALVELVRTHWDNGNSDYPPTSFQIVDIHAGDGVDNITPATLSATFNFRFCTESSVDSLCAGVSAILLEHGLDYELDWHLSGEPFLSEAGELRKAVSCAIADNTGLKTAFSTGGGTSDGRFIAPAGAEVIELGPVNATIHQVDECVAISELETLCRIYQAVLEQLLSPHSAAATPGA